MIALIITSIILLGFCSVAFFAWKKLKKLNPELKLKEVPQELFRAGLK